MNQNGIFTTDLSRGKFLKWALKIFSISLLFQSTGGCSSPQKIPKLRGISDQEYLNFQSVGEIFLDGNPVADFDIGKALDDYIYGHPNPLPTKDLVHELVGVPSSILVALALDFSITPLVKLERAKREKRLLSWKNSGSQLKRSLFSLLKLFSFFLLTGDKRFQKFSGYEA
ncbi:MAG: hypothetical protein K8R21_14865 [Leptospira sp.]|nr:hypothetical protein [Leptospira sp.]